MNDVAAPDAATDARDAAPPCPNDVPTSCIDPVPSYAKDVAPIIRERCAACHFDGGPADPPYDLSTWTNVDNADTAIINQLALCKMPPRTPIPKYHVGPAPQLTEPQRKTLFDWLICGAPNN